MTWAHRLAAWTSVALGIELMTAPAWLPGVTPAVADSLRTAGPLLAALGFLGGFAITAALRWLALVPAGWLVVAPLLIDHPGWALLNSVAAGVVAGLYLILAGAAPTAWDRYGGGWRAVLRGEPS